MNTPLVGFVRGLMMGWVHETFYQGHIESIAFGMTYVALLVLYDPVYQWLTHFEQQVIWFVFVETISVLIDTMLVCIIVSVFFAQSNARDVALMFIGIISSRTALSVYFIIKEEEPQQQQCDPSDYKRLINEV